MGSTSIYPQAGLKRGLQCIFHFKYWSTIMFTYLYKCLTRRFIFNLKSLRISFHIQDKLNTLSWPQRLSVILFLLLFADVSQQVPPFTHGLIHIEWLTLHKHTMFFLSLLFHLPKCLLPLFTWHILTHYSRFNVNGSITAKAFLVTTISIAHQA